MNDQTLVRRLCSLAVAGLSLASIPAGYASTLVLESEDTNCCRVVHSRQDTDLTFAAVKPTAQTAEDPRTVRMIYFRPNDRPFRQEVVDSMVVAILQIQAFFAEEMQRHGHGR
jgi:hypothetical protein